MAKRYYPIALELEGRVVLVAGGGKVAEQKVKGLLRFRAKVRLVSPDLTPGLRKLAKSGRISYIKRKVRASDLRRVGLVIAATSESAVNKKISQWARKEGALINVVDNSLLSDFISPAVFKASRAVVAVYTHGMDPVLSRDLKNYLLENWDVFLSYRNRL